MRILRVILFCLTACLCQAQRPIFISSSSGSDANNGLTPATAYKNQPYFASFTGSYTHQAGDQFLFFGGDTWVSPAAPLGAGGNPDNSDYYGTTNGWGANAPAVFDYGGAAHDGDGKTILYGAAFNNFVITNIVFSNFYFSDGTAFSGDSYLSFQGTNVLIEGCQFLNWSHDPASTISAFWAVQGNTATTSPGTIISNCLFDGGTNFGGNCGYSVLCMSEVIGCTFRRMVSGPLPNGDPCIVCFNNVGVMTNDFAGHHGAGIEPQGNAIHTYIFGNVIHDQPALNIAIGEANNPTGPTWIFDNLIYNSVPGALLCSTWSNAVNTVYVWNNTFDTSQGGSYGILVQTGGGQPAGTNWALLDARNNIFSGISSTVGVTTTVNTSNIICATKSDFASFHLSAPGYQPPNGSVLAGVGTNLSLAGLLTNSILSNATNDALRVARSANGGYTIGYVNTADATLLLQILGPHP